MAERQFTIVEDEAPSQAQNDVMATLRAEQARAAEKQKTAARMIAVGLGALAQRTLIAIANLFTLITVGSVFWLFLSIPDPNNYQLAGLAMYAVFVLAANWIVRRSK